MRRIENKKQEKSRRKQDKRKDTPLAPAKPNEIFTQPARANPKTGKTKNIKPRGTKEKHENQFGRKQKQEKQEKRKYRRQALSSPTKFSPSRPGPAQK